MTHPKSPIDLAVAALETIKRTITNKLHANGKTREEYILRFTDQALAALRAPPGKMTAAEEWTEEYLAGDKVIDVTEFFKRIQANALAAAQPEPRPCPECGKKPQ